MTWWLRYFGLVLIACQEFFTPIGFVLLVLEAHKDGRDIYNVSLISIQADLGGLTLVFLK